MCFHSKDEYDEWLRKRTLRSQRANAANGHAKTAQKYALIALRDEIGAFVAGWHCDPRNAQDVANTILDLKTWHDGEYRYIDTSDVDKERAKLKLAPLDQNGLPLPDRVARPGITDEEIHEGFARVDLARQIGVLRTASKTTRASHIRAGDAKEQERQKREYHERAKLAEAMGLTIEQLNDQEAVEKQSQEFAARGENTR